MRSYYNTTRQHTSGRLIADDTCDAVSDVHAAEWALSGRAADVAHLRMSSSRPVKLTLSPQGSAYVQASNLAQAGHTFFALWLTHSMNMHGRAAAMVTPIGDKKTLLPAESAVSSSGCAGRGRVKRAARERTNGSTRGCRERSDAKVCASASVAEPEGPSATLWTS